MRDGLDVDVAVIDERGRVRSCPEEVAALFGSRPVDLVGALLDDLSVGPTRRTIARAATDAASAGAEIGPIDLWIRRGDGAAVIRCWVRPVSEARFSLRVRDAAGDPFGVRAAIVEALVHERAAVDGSAAQVLRSTAHLVEWLLPTVRCSVGVAEDDGVVRHTHAPSASVRATAALDGLGPTSPLAAAARDAPALHVLDGVLAMTGPLGDAARADGFGRVWSLRVDDPGGGLVGLLALFTPEDFDPPADVVLSLRHVADALGSAISRANSVREQAHASLHDALTGLPNRRMLLRRIGESLGPPHDPDVSTAVFMIDLDDFKVANDTFGHGVGDVVLQHVADLLTERLRGGEALGRFGGDEFVVVTHVGGIDEARERAEAIRQALDGSLPLGAVTVRTAASVGVAVADHADDAVTLVRDADAALHRAKRFGRNRVEVFDQEMRAEMLDRIELESALRRGIGAGELVVHYQPVVDIETGEVESVEALARWRRTGTAELLSPRTFVPLAEDAGLIAALGSQVLEQAVGALAAVRRAGAPGLRLAVNVSPHQLNGELVDRIAAVLEAHDVEPSALCIEITESAITWDEGRAIVTRIAALGVIIAVDDFGTGYSSLDHLRRFPMADVLKIDGSFVADLEHTTSGQAIVSAALALGHSLGMSVTAEGVETEGQLQLLRELGCDRAQGYLLSAGVPAEELLDVIRGLSGEREVG